MNRLRRLLLKARLWIVDRDIAIASANGSQWARLLPSLEARRKELRFSLYALERGQPC